MARSQRVVAGWLTASVLILMLWCLVSFGYIVADSIVWAEILRCPDGVACSSPGWPSKLMLAAASAFGTAGSLVIAEWQSAARPERHQVLWFLTVLGCTFMIGSAFQSWLPPLVEVPTGLLTIYCLRRHSTRRTPALQTRSA